MAKHSPGPWKFRNHKWLDANGLAVVWPSRLGVDLHVSPADAALIARAPEMDAEIVALKASNAELLAALEPFAKMPTHRLYRDDHSVVLECGGVAWTVGDIEQATKAVAKAKGGV